MLAEQVYDRVRQRERSDPDVVGPVLELLADPTREGSAGTPAVREFAAELAERRHGTDVAEFVRHALTTAAVIDRVTAWTSRKTVAAARHRGQLLGLTAGREAYHPDWQFTATGVRDGVDDVVEALLAATSRDVVHADRVMRTRRDALQGRSYAELLAAGRTDEVLAALARYRDGFGE